MDINSRYMLGKEREAFDRWRNAMLRENMKNKFKCLLRLERLNKKLENNWVKDGFSSWKDSCGNKWLIFCV
jgi:hypothetical protein